MYSDIQVDITLAFLSQSFLNILSWRYRLSYWQIHITTKHQTIH